MRTLTIRNVPTELYEALTKQAKRRGRSLNSEALFQLESQLGQREMDVEEELNEIRAFRRRLKNFYVTEEEIQAAKNEGRP
jgi:plasmid stability protein